MSMISYTEWDWFFEDHDYELPTLYLLTDAEINNYVYREDAPKRVWVKRKEKSNVPIIQIHDVKHYATRIRKVLKSHENGK